MIWSCNIPLSTHFKITEMGNYKIGNSKSNVNEDYISTAPIFRIFTIFSHDWLHSFNISTYVTVDAQSRLSWPSTSACSSNLVPRAFSLAWRRGGKKGQGKRPWERGCLLFHFLGRNVPQCEVVHVAPKMNYSFIIERANTYSFNHRESQFLQQI